LILDPRLVPWADVAPGIALAAAIAATGSFLAVKRNFAGSILLLLSPLIGWTLMIWQIEDKLPKIPPADVGLWCWYFALGGGAVGLIYSWWQKWPLGPRVAAPALIAAAVATAVYFALTAPFSDEVMQALPAQFILALVLGAFLIFFSLYPAKSDLPAPAHHAADITPALVGLASFSAILTLTGTAAVGMLALGLCLASLPMAVGLLILSSCARAPVQLSPAYWAPQVIALPVFACLGPLYASTTWTHAIIVISGCAAAALFIVAARWIIRRRALRSSTEKSPFRLPGLREELILILGAVILAGAPAAYVASVLLKQADESGAY
jgi:hypothetical protein